MYLVKPLVSRDVIPCVLDLCLPDLVSKLALLYLLKEYGHPNVNSLSEKVTIKFAA